MSSTADRVQKVMAGVKFYNNNPRGKGGRGRGPPGRTRGGGRNGARGKEEFLFGNSLNISVKFKMNQLACYPGILLPKMICQLFLILCFYYTYLCRYFILWSLYDVDFHLFLYVCNFVSC